jgi:DDE superfamily endonuclease
LATGKRGLKKGLKRRPRTVILFLDSTIFSEIPPLRAMWAPIGEQVRVPITGSHGNLFLTGVLNIQTGDYLDYVSEHFCQANFQEVLRLIRSHWRGWHIVLFLDRNKPHRTPASRRLARQLGIQLRWLPTACPELNILDCLWRHLKDEVIANQPTPNLEAVLECARDYLAQLSPRARLEQADVLAPGFWLADVLA